MSPRDTTGTAVRIASVFPDLLGTYGDGGNVRVLERRLAWRGKPVEVVEVRLGDPVPAEADLYVLGGGEDDAQAGALRLLRSSTMVRAVERGAHVFAVCAGLQLLGRSFSGADGVLHEGLGLLDLTTTRLPSRVVGEVVADLSPELGLPALNGFANHRGGTVLDGDAVPLATTTRGKGNDGTAGGAEGARQGRVVATYLHGPVLARNPALADWVLSQVTGEELAPLPAGPAEALHAERTRGA